MPSISESGAISLESIRIAKYGDTRVDLGIGKDSVAFDSLVDVLSTNQVRKQPDS